MGHVCNEAKKGRAFVLPREAAGKHRTDSFFHAMSKRSMTGGPGLLRESQRD
jgi:hypothetical protein